MAYKHLSIRKLTPIANFWALKTHILLLYLPSLLILNNVIKYLNNLKANDIVKLINLVIVFTSDIMIKEHSKYDNATCGMSNLGTLMEPK